MKVILCKLAGPAILIGIILALLAGCASTTKTVSPVEPAKSLPVEPAKPASPPIQTRAAAEVVRAAPPASQVITTADFVAVVVQPGDTLSTLAARYLNDPAREWEIAEYNGIASISPGQELVIPLAPFKLGGLFTGRYQVVPVLSYHKFAEKSTDKMTVSREAFESQMNLLRERGFRVVTLDQLFDFMEYRAQLPEKSVVITIDDGWRSTYDIAMPILKKYGFPATIFVYTQLITGGAKTLSWEQLREMAEQGIDVQAHTATHRNLLLQKDKETAEEYLASLQRELLESSRIIEQKFGKRPKYLAYPYGDTNGLVIALLRQDGYRGALTVFRDENPFFLSEFRLNRAMVFGDHDLGKFEKNLSVYDRRALR